MKEAEPNKYKKCYVAYLDLLGFSRKCIEAKYDCSQIKKLFNDIEALKYRYDSDFFEFVLPAEIYDNTSFTIMSDSIFISAPCSDDGLIFILFLCKSIQNMLFKQGCTIRGGIAKGNFFKLDNIMFGPALIEAYTLEAKEAKYPRIVIAKDIIDDILNRNTYNKEISPTESINMTYKTNHEISCFRAFDTYIIKSEYDSMYFVHYLNQINIQTMSHNENVINTINKGLNDKDPHVSEKYKWLQKYFEESLKNVLVSPPETQAQ